MRNYELDDIRADDVEITINFDHEFFDVEAHYLGQRVGYAYCQDLGKTLVLLDIEVSEHLPLRWTYFHNILTLLGIHRCIRLRRRGIGSRILGRVLSEAENIGVTEVWGSIVKNDIDRIPSLLDWYARHGFTISEPDDKGMENAVKKISIRLTLASPKKYK